MPDSVSVQALRELLKSSEPPIVLDVRRPHAFAESPDMIPGAARRLPESVGSWADELPTSCQVVAYCVYGGQVSQDVVARLKQRGIKASFLEGGIEQWSADGGSLLAAEHDPKVRVATTNDAVAFSHIGAATFALACPPSTPESDIRSYIASELTPARFKEHIESETASLFAAEAGGKVVGYLMLCRENSPSGVKAEKPVEVRRLYVLSQHHGSGVAAALMLRAFQEAAANQNDTLWLAVSKHNRRGIAFYRKHGFGVVGEQQFVVGSDIHEDLIMARRT